MRKIGKNVKLDVEFALDKNGKLNIFKFDQSQLRKIGNSSKGKFF